MRSATGDGTTADASGDGTTADASGPRGVGGHHARAAGGCFVPVTAERHSPVRTARCQLSRVKAMVVFVTAYWTPIRYLDAASSHEQAAAELDLSRWTDFRRLKAASDRIAEYVATQFELMIATEWRGSAGRTDRPL